jgi:hypothetical protein
MTLYRASIKLGYPDKNGNRLEKMKSVEGDACDKNPRAEEKTERIFPLIFSLRLTGRCQ